MLGSGHHDEQRPRLAGREQLSRFLDRHARTGRGTLFLIRLHRYSEMAIGLAPTELRQLIDDLWNELEGFVRDRGQVFRADTAHFGFVWHDELDHPRCMLACTRLLERLRHLPFCNHADLEISLQIGVACGEADTDETTHWVNRAYLALAQTHPTFPPFVVFNEEMERSLIKRWKLRQGLARALERQQFELVYQPRIDLPDGTCNSVEALLRWNHPQHGTMLPDDFVPLLEDSGAIIELTQWVLHRASRELGQWLRETPERSFAFNVSTKVLTDPEFGGAIRHSIGLWGLDPAQLIVEVTETAAWEERESSIMVLNELRSFGLRVAIDDFGTGYSTLDYLRRLPADQMKIDRSFVSHMDSSTQDEFLVEATIRIGHQLGLTVIAEGVESEAQLKRLEELGCDGAQGYAIGVPMAVDDLLQWSRENQRRTA